MFFHSALARLLITALLGICSLTAFVPAYSQVAPGVLQPFEPRLPVPPELKENPKNIPRALPDAGENRDGLGQKPSKATSEVTVYLGSGVSINGKIEIPPEIIFKHTKEGIEYKKKITPAEILEIEILSYRIKNKNSLQNGSTFYEFEPERVKLILRNGREYFFTTLFSFLKIIKLDTPDGKTRLYTYFADTFEPKKGWEHVQNKNRDYHKDKPHPNCVVRLKFR